jgi:DNA repair exonuclease SbcCD ATPase subunit
MKLNITLAESAKKNKASQLKAQLKQAEADLRDMSVTPHSEKDADAIDDARADVTRLKNELRELGEGVGYTAEEAYQRHLKEVQTKLQQISQEIQAHSQRQTSGTTNWGYVGDVSRVNELLGDIIEFLSGGE